VKSINGSCKILDHDLCTGTNSTPDSRKRALTIKSREKRVERKDGNVLIYYLKNRVFIFKNEKT